MTACATERVVEKPVPFEVTATEYIPVPPDLLLRRNKSTLPDTLSYGEALQLWAEDRANLDKLNGQIDGIISLGNETRDD